MLAGRGSLQCWEPKRPSSSTESESQQTWKTDQKLRTSRSMCSNSPEMQSDFRLDERWSRPTLELDEPIRPCLRSAASISTRSSRPPADPSGKSSPTCAPARTLRIARIADEPADLPSAIALLDPELEELANHVNLTKLDDEKYDRLVGLGEVGEGGEERSWR